jgi:cell division protein FtsZ
MDNEDFSRDAQSVGDRQIRIKIVGIGDAGGNVADRIKLDDLGQDALAIINTDAKAVSNSPIQEKLLIGRALTRGMSAGGEAEIGRKAAEADTEAIGKILDGVDLVFIIAGLGGGTGSGAAPVVASAAENAGAVVLAFVTMPFTREGERRRKQAEEALSQMRECCHAVIALPNDMLLQQVDENATVLETFAVADRLIGRGVRAIHSMLTQSGLMSVDFATLRNVLRFRGGKTLFGLGRGEGEDVVKKALADLDLCPMLHLPDYKYANKADSLIINICGGPGMSMSHVNQIMDSVCEKFGSRQNNAIAAAIDDTMKDAIEITVIGATEVSGGSAAAIAAREAAQRRRAAFSAAVAAKQQVAQPDKPLVPPQPVAEESPKQVAAKAAQHEFDFKGPDERGFFEKTEANLYNGEDLDVPTFLRRGIRIQV